MKRIDTANKATDLFGAGKHGYRPGNPAAGQNPTECSPDAFNAIQEEIANVIEGSGLALNPASNAQLLAAIQGLISNRNISGLVRSLTPVGGALVREYADVTNAASVGGIEIGTSYNCAIDTTTGVWLGRDVADICWLEKWHDTAGTKEFWVAPTAIAGVAPVWTKIFHLDMVGGGMYLAQEAGHVAFFARDTAPAGYFKANGAAISRGVYGTLFAAIGTTYGIGDGSTTFNLPDLRGEFLRGFDDGRGIDTGRGFGSAQAGMSQINPGVIVRSGTFGVPDGIYDATGISSIVGGGDMNPAPVGSSATAYPETRPRNVALLACIKY